MIFDSLPSHLDFEIVRLLAPEEKMLLTANSDLTEDGKFDEQWIVVTNQRILTFYPNRDGSNPLIELPLAEIKEVKTEVLVGGGYIEISTDRKSISILHFSNSLVDKFSEVVRGIQQLSKGEKLRLSPDRPKTHCDKCRKRLPEKDGICPACIKKSTVFIRIMSFLKSYWKSVAMMIAVTLVGTFVNLLPPFITKHIMDDAIVPIGGVILTTSQRLTMLVWLVVALLGVRVLASLSEVSHGRLAALIGNQVTADIRAAVFRCIERLSLAFHSKRETGAILSRLTRDTERLQDFLIEGLPYIIIEILTMTGILAFLFYMSWELTLWVLIPTPILVVGGHWFWRKMRPMWKRSWSKFEKLYGHINENLSGIRVVKAFAQEDGEIVKFNRHNRAAMNAGIQADRIEPGFWAAINFAGSIGMLLLWLIGGKHVIREEISLGTLIAFQGYMWMLYGPLEWLSQVNQWMTRAFTSAERIFELMDTVPESYDLENAIPLPEMEGKVEFKDVEFGYDKSKPVLKGVNLTVEPGEMIGLVGKSGAGKTTMINLVCRFFEVDNGLLEIDSIDLKKIRLEDLRGKIGIVLQDSFLFNSSIMENIAYAKPDATFEEIVEAAKIANAHHFILAKTDGYNTIVGERGNELSGGEKQRISIARAILHNPKILILDEATSSVDIETEKQIQEAISRLVKGRTTFAIAHRLSTLRNADRLVVLDEGKIVEVGNHAELMEKKGVFYKLVQTYQDISKAVAYAE